MLVVELVLEEVDEDELDDDDVVDESVVEVDDEASEFELDELDEALTELLAA